MSEAKTLEEILRENSLYLDEEIGRRLKKAFKEWLIQKNKTLNPMKNQDVQITNYNNGKRQVIDELLEELEK